MATKNISIAILGAYGRTRPPHVYEQAHQFASAQESRSAHAMTVLRSLGIEEWLRRIAFEPVSHCASVDV